MRIRTADVCVMFVKELSWLLYPRGLNLPSSGGPCNAQRATTDRRFGQTICVTTAQRWQHPLTKCFAIKALKARTTRNQLFVLPLTSGYGASNFAKDLIRQFVRRYSAVGQDLHKHVVSYTVLNVELQHARN